MFFPFIVRQNFKSIFINAMWIFTASYFAYHVVTGTRGLLSWVKLSEKANELEKELQILRAENNFLENKINLLRNEHLDLDLLEEQAISMLGMINKDDIVVLLPQ